MKRRAWFRLAGGLLAAVALLMALAVIMLDSDGFARVGDCGSDNMSATAFELQRYRAEHGGELPGSRAEFVAYMVRARGVDRFRCAANGHGYLWRPGRRDEKGREIVAMCPPGSHGLIRKYSLGLVVSGPTAIVCVVRGSRVQSLEAR